jgi:hypothetical protein
MVSEKNGRRYTPRFKFQVVMEILSGTKAMRRKARRLILMSTAQRLGMIVRRCTPSNRPEAGIHRVAENGNRHAVVTLKHKVRPGITSTGAIAGAGAGRRRGSFTGPRTKGQAVGLDREKRL